MKTETLQVGGDAIAIYQSDGTGPAALLVHGNSCSLNCYKHQLQGPLGDTYRLVALDLPGHGQSANASNPTATYNLPGYAHVVAEVARQLHLTNAVIVGWSLGGSVVLEASEQLPDAAGIVLFGAPPIGFPPAMDQAFLPNPAMRLAFQPTLTHEEAIEFASGFFKPGTTPPDRFVEDVVRTDGLARQLVVSNLGPGTYKDEVVIVGNLAKPLAVFHGDQDQLVNKAYVVAQTMPTLWRGAVQLIHGAGHAIQWEQHHQFNALLEAFLQETAG
jgi:pimeloyl-ACP methyl ester carboxylesterase